MISAMYEKSKYAAISLCAFNYLNTLQQKTNIAAH
jgi:hypothetical protein